MANDRLTQLYVKLIVVVALIVISGVAIWQKRIPLGLDLRGGSELLYRIRTEDLSDAKRRNVTQETINVIRKRVDPGGRMELDIRPRGKYRFQGLRPGAFGISYSYSDMRLESASIGPIQGRKVQVEVLPGGTIRNVDLYMRVLAKPSEVRGRVLDERGLAVAGAKVVCVTHQCRAAETDAGGRYLIAGVPPGEQRFLARDPSLGKYGEEAVTLVAGQRAQLDLVLLQPGSQISGRVSDSEGKSIRGKALVTVSTGLVQESVEVGEDGLYATSATLPPNRYRVSLRVDDAIIQPKEGHRVKLREAELAEDINFTVEQMVEAVAGRVVDSFGAPLGDVRVYLDGWNVAKWIMTDNEGVFRFENVGGADLRLTVGRAPDANQIGDSAWVQIKPVAAGTEDLIVELIPAGILRGVVLFDRDNTEHAWVQVNGAQGFVDILQLPSEQFEFNLEPGTYVLTFRYPDGEGPTHRLDEVIIETEYVTDIGVVDITVAGDGEVSE